MQVHTRNLGNTAHEELNEEDMSAREISYKYKQWCKRNQSDKQKDDMEEENKEAATALIKEFGLILQKSSEGRQSPFKLSKTGSFTFDTDNNLNIVHLKRISTSNPDVHLSRSRPHPQRCFSFVANSLKKTSPRRRSSMDALNSSLCNGDMNQDLAKLQMHNSKTYNIWLKDKSKYADAFSVSRQKESLVQSLAEFNEWLNEVKAQLDDDVASFKVFDLQLIRDKRKDIEELNDDIEDHTSKAHSLSEACQRFCQLLPPGEERLELKGEISKTRRKMNELALESTKRREIFRKSVPLLRQYCEDRDKVIEWLDDIELKVEPFIDKYNKDDVLLQYGEEIENTVAEFEREKEVYQSCLTYGESLLDMLPEPQEELKRQSEELINRWDSLCSALEKCLNRLELARKLEEESKKSEAAKIDRKIRQEVQRCNCCDPFQIVRVGEGKYTFGSSKIVRLVRIHGTSVVVRVGGGWQYFLDFLMKCDPCRAKQIEETGVDGISELGLTPVDKRRSSFSYEVRRNFGHKNSKHHVRVISSSSLSLNSDPEKEQPSLSSSLDSLDSISSGKDGENINSTKMNGNVSSKRCPTGKHVNGKSRPSLDGRRSSNIADYRTSSSKTPEPKLVNGDKARRSSQFERSSKTPEPTLLSGDKARRSSQFERSSKTPEPTILNGDKARRNSQFARSSKTPEPTILNGDKARRSSQVERSSKTPEPKPLNEDRTRKSGQVERSSKTPEPRPVSAKLSDSKSRIYKTPESSSMTPDMQRKTSKTPEPTSSSSKTPQSTKTPKMSSKTPEVPHQSSKTPEVKLSSKTPVTKPASANENSRISLVERQAEHTKKTK